jgi:hypothetical protein
VTEARYFELLGCILSTTFSDFYKHFQDSLEHALGYMAEFLGLGEDAGGSVVVNKEFGVSGGWGDIAQLLASRVAGEISRETYWKELQRRGYLADDFDPEVEASRLGSEVPGADGLAPTLKD